MSGPGVSNPGVGSSGVGSYVVQPADPRRIADAVIAYQVQQPRFLGAALFAIAVFAAAGGITYGASGAVVGALIMIVLQGLVVVFKRAQLHRLMAARGYRPGSSIEAAFDDASFRIVTERGSGDHPYDWVADVRELRGVVVLRLREARLVIALPREVVPDGAVQRVRAGMAS